MNNDLRPGPPRPISPPPAGGAWLPVAVVGGVLGFLVLSCVAVGFFRPLAILVGAILLLFCLPYLVWGWLFERIYRSADASDPLHEHGDGE